MQGAELHVSPNAKCSHQCPLLSQETWESDITATVNMAQEVLVDVGLNSVIRGALVTWTDIATNLPCMG